jgi:alanine-glyoxylate transaminase/serine-glyoxylate transaminase/serine-pyruvate transaminase
MTTYAELDPSQRILLGPGPSCVHPRVYRALGTQIIGHLDPEFLQIMDEIQTLLRFVFETRNQFTIAVSGTGSAGMEAAFANVVEAGDTVVVGVNGVFGNRMCDVVSRCGAHPVRVEAEWGKAIETDKIAEALKKHKPVKAVALVHAETSTGVQQPLQGIGALCHEHDALFIVDAVTSLAGIPVKVDDHAIDVCYSGTQKCLSCPPGLAPLTLNDRALAIARQRKTQVQSWYLDITMIADYWSDKSRAYHHTAPINMNYALREALRLVHEEGLSARFERHQGNSKMLLANLAELGLRPFVDASIRLPTLNAITIPDGCDDAAIRRKLLHDYDIEIGGGLGDLKGKVWRVGLMGESSRKANIVYLASALQDIL